MAGNLRARGPSVQTWVFPHLIAWLESQSIDAAPISRLPGIVGNDPDRRVSESTAEAAWRLAATMTNDAAIGVHVAEWLPRGALDLIEYAVRSSPSLASGLERFARYGCLVSDRVAARTEIERQWAAADHPRRRFVGAASGASGVRAGARVEARPRCHRSLDRSGPGRLRSSSP